MSIKKSYFKVTLVTCNVFMVQAYIEDTLEQSIAKW